MPDKKLEFWFDFGSTYSYPAAMRIEDAAAAHGVGVSWRTFLLGAIFKAQGMNDSPFNLFPARGRYMWRDLERVCQAENLPFRRPSQFPRNGLLAARVACWYADASWLPEFVKGIYRANFEQDRDIADAAIVSACLAAVGQDAREVLAQAQAAESKAKLRVRTGEAAVRGIFGAPFFLVGDEPFWGNDRLEEAISWCVTHTGPRNSQD